MSITKDVPVPTAYNRLNQNKIFNIYTKLLMVWIPIVVIYISYISVLWNLGIHIFFMYAVPGAGLLIFMYKYARDIVTLDSSIAHVKLLWRILRRKTDTRKFDIPIEDLKSLVPIQSIEESGLIRYTDDSSGVILILDPPRVPEDNLDKHSKSMRNVVNSLLIGYTFQFLTISLPESKNNLSSTTLDIMKKSHSVEVTRLLNSLYLESVTHNTVIDWIFLLVVTIPPTKNVIEAEKLKNMFLSGLQKELWRANIVSRAVDNRLEVITLLRECFI